MACNPSSGTNLKILVKERRLLLDNGLVVCPPEGNPLFGLDALIPEASTSIVKSLGKRGEGNNQEIAFLIVVN